jgi:prepilin-type processing-associated H-X9-DG protein
MLQTIQAKTLAHADRSDRVQAIGGTAAIRRKPFREGFSAVELIVLLAILATLIGIVVPAVQRARSTAEKCRCANNLYQLGLGLSAYAAISGSFPPGVTSDSSGDQFPWMTWHTRLLPFIEQEPLWAQTQAAYQQDSDPFQDPPHFGLATPVRLFACPLDQRTADAQITHEGLRVALTSYVGVLGIDYTTELGVLFRDSHIRVTDIVDGTSSTLMVGERPPSTDAWYGWWYAAVAQDGTGSPDVVLGVRERQSNGAYLGLCGSGPYHYVEGDQANQCDVLHYWSLHPGGANFLFADGSVHFLSYSADDILPALATRKGGETVSPPD